MATRQNSFGTSGRYLTKESFGRSYNLRCHKERPLVASKALFYSTKRMDIFERKPPFAALNSIMPMNEETRCGVVRVLLLAKCPPFPLHAILATSTILT